MPPSRGTKPRKYCCVKCRRLGVRGISGRNSRPHLCVDCGSPVQYCGRGRRRIKCNSCRGRCSVQCGRCGVTFHGPPGRQFCSNRCRYGKLITDPVPCEICGDRFVRQKGRHGSKYCSKACSRVAVAARVKKTADIARLRAVTYKCLNCDKCFRRKAYKSGSYSRQTKYCSRDCAFEARRRRLPCTRENGRKHSQLSYKLALWFASWAVEADRQSRAAVRKSCSCERCGERFTTPEKSSETRCADCRRHVPCLECGEETERGTTDPRRKRCAACRSLQKRRMREKHRRKRRSLKGHETTFRKRCRKYGAPYEPVSKSEVMRRDGWTCRICFQPLLRKFTILPGTRTPHNLSPTIDHIVPLSCGPASPGHTLQNCQAACWGCNCLRGNKPLDSFVLRRATGLD